MYIALEGVVGVGKSTQTKLLTQWLEEECGKSVLAVREPGGTVVAEAIRELVQGNGFEESMDPVTDAYLYAAARAQLLRTVVRKALDDGKTVISDRCVATSLSYQGTAQGYGIGKVWKINEAAVEGCLPDRIVFFDMPIEDGVKRAFDPDGDKWERMDMNFFKQAYDGYQSLFSFEPIADRMRSVDASGSVEEVFERLKAVIKPFVR